MNTTGKTGIMKLGYIKNLKPNINGENCISALSKNYRKKNHFKRH